MTNNLYVLMAPLSRQFAGANPQPPVNDEESCDDAESCNDVGIPMMLEEADDNQSEAPIAVETPDVGKIRDLGLL